MKHIHQRDGANSTKRTDTFTGDVWGDPVLPTADGVTANNVFFAPKARTYWHSHEHGQYIHVVAGKGKVLTIDGEEAIVSAGDVVWSAPGEMHCHGATSDSYMVHMAVSLGQTDWRDEVRDEDYGS